MFTHIRTLLVLAACLTTTLSVLAQSSAANSTVFMRLVGPDGAMEGEVVSKGREGWHRVQGFSHEIISPRDAASGLPTGKRQHTPFRVIKLINKSSPLLLSALGKNQQLPTVEVSIWTPTNIGTEERVVTYKLVNAGIASIRPWMPNKNDPQTTNYPPAEELSLTYQSIEVTSHNGNVIATDTWNGSGS